MLGSFLFATIIFYCIHPDVNTQIISQQTNVPWLHKHTHNVFLFSFVIIGLFSPVMQCIWYTCRGGRQPATNYFFFQPCTFLLFLFSLKGHTTEYSPGISKFHRDVCSPLFKMVVNCCWCSWRVVMFHVRYGWHLWFLKVSRVLFVCNRIEKAAKKTKKKIRRSNCQQTNYKKILPVFHSKFLVHIWIADLCICTSIRNMEWASSTYPGWEVSMWCPFYSSDVLMGCSGDDVVYSTKSPWSYAEIEIKVLN